MPAKKKHASKSGFKLFKLIRKIILFIIFVGIIFYGLTYFLPPKSSADVSSDISQKIKNSTLTIKEKTFEVMDMGMKKLNIPKNITQAKEKSADIILENYRKEIKNLPQTEAQKLRQNLCQELP